MKVLFASSEVYPFAKSGGLGDVAGSLPGALKKKGIDVRVMMPKYKDIPETYVKDMVKIGDFTIDLKITVQNCEIFKLEYNDVTYYFVGNDYYFNRDGLYGYYDEAERFLFFSRAVLEFVPRFDFWPDIVHCNDWQTAVIPFLLNKQYRQHYNQLKTVLTIHNIKYQGRYGVDTLYALLGLTPEDITSDIEYYKDTNILKAGIFNADWINTVSPTYAKELEFEYYAEGLSGVIKENNYKFSGILNGIDYWKNHPQNDPNLYVNYTTSIQKKKENKRMLLEELGLTYDDDKPVVSVISRLDEHKGVDLIVHVLNDIISKDAYFVLLGTGDKKYEDAFRYFQYIYPNNVSANITFSGAMASKLYAASDIFLMPSRTEPCGLSQIIALKYGAVPVVRKTGGLNATISSFDPETREGNGVLFNNYNAHEMLAAIDYAINLYKNEPENWQKLVKNAFKSKFDWDTSADEYINVYNRII